MTSSALPCFPDMLQLIHNQDMEFGGLFDHAPFPAPPAPVQDLTALPPSSSTPSSTTTATTSSILSSSPHLDALLGPPITRSSSTPDKVFQPPTFQQSPLAQVTPTPAAPRQQPASLQTSQPKAQPTPPALHPSSQTAQSLATSPVKNPVFNSSPQVPQQQQQQQPVANYPNQNGYTGRE